jgi:hypothetical protein
MEENEPEIFHNQMIHDHHHPFQNLLSEDDSYTVHVQQNVPLRGCTSVILQTDNVEFLVKQWQFFKQKKKSPNDFQFCLRGKFKSNNATGVRIRKLKRKLDDEDDFCLVDPKKLNKYPLLEDCLPGIEQSVSKVLLNLKDFCAYKKLEKKQRCHLTLCHRMLDRGMKIGIFCLESEDLHRVTDILMTRLSNFINSTGYLPLELLLDDSFQVRFLVSIVQSVRSQQSS